MMKRAILTRTETGDQGTFGRLVVEGTDFNCVTLELPWRNNASGKSCIPAGTYLFKMTNSPKHGLCYEEWDDPATKEKEDVPDRDHIQIHSANLAGDEAKGYISQLLGCLALGVEAVTFKAGTPPAGDKDQRGISASRATVEAFEKEMDYKQVRLVLQWRKGAEPKGET